MMQEAADRTVTWQSQWHVKTGMASMKHPPGVRGGGEEQGARQVKAERGRRGWRQRRRRRQNCVRWGQKGKRQRNGDSWGKATTLEARVTWPMEKLTLEVVGYSASVFTVSWPPLAVWALWAETVTLQYEFIIENYICCLFYKDKILLSPYMK